MYRNCSKTSAPRQDAGAWSALGLTQRTNWGLVLSTVRVSSRSDLPKALATHSRRRLPRRAALAPLRSTATFVENNEATSGFEDAASVDAPASGTVSYTHLTLPTIE